MKVAWPTPLLTGLERQRQPDNSGLGPCSSKKQSVAFDSAFDWSAALIRIVLLVGVFFGLVAALPLAAHASDNSIPPLRYEVRDPVVPGSLALSPFTLPPPQWRSIEQMDRTERRAMLVQLAAETVVNNSTLETLKGVWMAVREPIRSEDGSLSCKTRLSIKTYFMRCHLKF